MNCISRFTTQIHEYLGSWTRGLYFAVATVSLAFAWLCILLANALVFDKAPIDSASIVRAGALFGVGMFAFAVFAVRIGLIAAVRAWRGGANRRSELRTQLKSEYEQAISRPKDTTE